MKTIKTFIAAALCAALAFQACAPKHEASLIRPSAYPLVTIDPYTSAWSVTDNLFDSQVQHWTGRDFPLEGILTVDGTAYRFMGEDICGFDLLLANGTQKPWECRYTTAEPAGDWTAPDYNDSRWDMGEGAFGFGTPDSIFSTEWATPFIWVRREFFLSEDMTGKEVYLEYSHDDDASFYVNGVEVASWDDSNECNKRLRLNDEATASLKAGRNVIAAKCWNRRGNAMLDMGLSCMSASATGSTVAVQNSVDVQATQTHYLFTCGPVDMKLTFTSPLLLDRLDLVSRPVNYISYNVSSNDGAAHDVSIRFIATGAWATHMPFQKVTMENGEHNGLVYLKAGTEEQNILGRKGDSVCIDWGYFYLCSEKEGTSSQIDGGAMILDRALGDGVKACAGKIMVGYDDIFSVRYFGENLRPYWNKDGNSSIMDQFSAANDQYASLMKDCEKFDCALMADATEAGGRKYAELCALAYRQAIAAHKLVEAPNGDLLWLSKENNSNGSIGTVDVTYPSAPLFLLYNPELAKGLLNHIFYYSESGKWTKPFPAHDVGTYPIAEGQTYGGDMPVEEAGNALTLTAAICHYQNDYGYAEQHWETLSVWAEYLSRFGLDPENQLCTDDFAGRSAHNTNLSIKAILALASYGRMAEKLGHGDIAVKYTDMAKEMASQWIEMADDGDHYRRTFDKSGTWSQKYNLVWDKLLGLGIFPEDVARKEIAFYPSVENEYGLPLDERMAYTKTDWIVWTATMAESQEDFEHFVDYIYKFQCETTTRIPMSDWVWTDKATHAGFKARSVVGGYFIKMLK